MTSMTFFNDKCYKSKNHECFYSTTSHVTVILKFLIYTKRSTKSTKLSKVYRTFAFGRDRLPCCVMFTFLFFNLDIQPKEKTVALTVSNHNACLKYCHNFHHHLFSIVFATIASLILRHLIIFGHFFMLEPSLEIVDLWSSIPVKSLVQVL